MHGRPGCPKDVKELCVCVGQGQRVPERAHGAAHRSVCVASCWPFLGHAASGGVCLSEAPFKAIGK